MKSSKRIISVIAGVLVMLFAGFIYAWSILSAPIAAEFPAWTSAQLSLTFTICMTFFCLGGLAAGILVKRVPARINVLIAAALFLVGFFLASRAQGPLSLYLSYGVLCGTAAGFAYNAVMSTIPKRYPHNQGLISGVLLMGFGASSMIIGSAFTALTPDTVGAWRSSLLFMGVLMAAVLAIGSFFFRLPESGAGETAAAAQTVSDRSPAEMLRRPSFWCFFVWATLLSAAGLAVIAQARPIAVAVGPALSAGNISLVVGLISICNGLGRIIIGAMFDKFGQKITMASVIGFFLGGAVCITLSSVLASIPLLVVGFVCLGIGYGGGPTTSAAFTRAFYGSKHYSVNFSIANLNLMIASLGSTAAGALYDMTGSFAATFVFLFVCIAVAIAALFGIRKP